MVPQSTKVLIVEDDPEISQLLQDNLNATGFKAATAEDGKSMFAALAENSFDILLLDIMLPGEDGLSLCRKLRTPEAPYEDLPIIFLTALGEMTDRVVGLKWARMRIWSSLLKCGSLSLLYGLYCAEQTGAGKIIPVKAPSLWR